MKLTKLLSAGLAFSMAVSLLAGCGSKPKETTKPEMETGKTSEESVATEPAKEDEGKGIPEDHVWGKYEDPVTLTYARSHGQYDKTDPNDPDIKSLDENIWYRTYEEDLGIKVENLWTADGGDYDQKWMTSMVSGDIPDFGVVSSKVYRQLLEAGLVMDTTEIFEEYASDLYKEYCEAEDWISYNALTKDGRLYGFPYNGYTTENVNLIYIRKDWLDEVDMEVPKTIDELEALMDAFIEAELGGPDTLGMGSFKYVRSNYNFIAGVLEGYGAYHNIWLEEEGELVYSNTTKKFKDGLLRLQEWYEKGYVREDFLTLGTTSGGEDLAAGRCGIVYGYYYVPITGGVFSSFANDNAEWVVAEIPTLDGSPAVSQGNVDSSVDVQAFFVSKDCKNPEAVIQLINFSLAVRANQNPDYEDTAYNTRADQTEVFNLSILRGSAKSWANLQCHYDCMEALKAGTDANIPGTAKGTYDQIIAAQNGVVEAKGLELVFGENDAYAVIGKMKDEGRILVTAYQTGPTETMLNKNTDLQANLEAAMLKVIMGEDISVYEEALDTWYKTGGEQITKEVNDWYKSK